MSQHILIPGPLLNEKGCPVQAGYSTRPVMIYDRSMIKAGPMKIKEWDYYYVGNDEFGTALTLADNSYMGIISVSLLDFRKKKYKTVSRINLFTMGKTKMPSSPLTGDVTCEKKDCYISFRHTNENTRRLICMMKNFDENKDFECDITLGSPPEDFMAIVIPFHKNTKAFYYNVKINCMTAKGKLRCGNDERTFDPASSMGLLDWGRGVWTYDNTWYWASLSARDENGTPFGFNLGYGFGDTSKATENMIFFDGKAHKTEHVIFSIPRSDKGKYLYTREWKISSDDNRVNLRFTPVLDRTDNTDLLLLASLQHQVFGYFNGTLVKNNGDVIHVDNKLGFAERVTNRW